MCEEIVFFGEWVHNVLTMGERLFSAGEGSYNNLTEGQLYLLRARELHFVCLYIEMRFRGFGIFRSLVSL